MDMRRRNTGIRLGNRGSTLIELIISITIASIILGALTLFMWSSITSYRASRDDIRLQVEAQTILNQLKNLIMEANNVKYDQAEGTLLIQHEDSLHIVSHNTMEHTLEYEKVPLNSAPAGVTKLFGQYVEAFSVIDTGSFDCNTRIEITFKLKKSKRTCEISDSVVVLRNRVSPMRAL